MGAPPDPLAARLADIRGRLDHPPGVMLGVLRLPIMDSLLEELEARSADVERDPSLALSRELATEIELTVGLLSTGLLGTSAEGVARRLRLVEVLRRAGSGRLPPLAFDEADAFGAEMHAMVATDADLAAALGRLHPLLIRATSVAPSGRWLAAAEALLRAGDRVPLASATQRTLASLVRADIVSRPDLLEGGLRLANQRLGRGLLWFASVALDAPAELLGTVGVRMGTSGRTDAVVRDTAVANTCAALLGGSTDPGAAAALASMRVRVTNRNVLKQIDRALASVAARAGVPVEEVIELALPAFGLDEHGRLELDVGDATAILALTGSGKVEQRWRLRDGRELAGPPADLASSEPGEVAGVRERVDAIESAVVDERRRMDARMASRRSWPEASWRRRFLEHPIGGHFGRRLVWVVETDPSGGTPAIATGDGWQGADGRPLPVSTAGPRAVWLWHPVDAAAADVAAWRASLAAAGIEQPIRQADREAFRPLARDRGLAADRRFAGRIVDHARLRALLRQRGWAVPSLGSWDQGDEATAWRAFDDGLRAELRYQAVERLPTGIRHEQARLVAVRFVIIVAAPGTTGPGAEEPSAAGHRPLDLSAVPARVVSEAIRDVSLAVSVGEVPPGS